MVSKLHGLREKISFTIAMKRIKYLEINLPKETKEFRKTQHLEKQNFSPN